MKQNESCNSESRQHPTVSNAFRLLDEWLDTISSRLIKLASTGGKFTRRRVPGSEIEEAKKKEKLFASGKRSSRLDASTKGISAVVVE